jgi:3-phosphoshikimate 1-carboxyvinyltransferase
MHAGPPQPLTSHAAPGPLSGVVRVPGDKSISHRALMLGAVAAGETVIAGLLEGDDVRATAMAVRALGARVEREPSGLWHVHGVGHAGLAEPSAPLDLGNAGTGVRLLMGLVAGHPITAVFTGDASLSARPMGRVLEPLARMGATHLARAGGRLPVALRGAQALAPINYTPPVPSAQVKSAVLLAALRADGTTTVTEPTPTREHTEVMLAHFGADVAVEGGAVSVTGGRVLRGCAVDVPADPSAAAFPALAALLVEGSEVRLPGVLVSARRDGFFRAAQRMGADIVYAAQRAGGAGPVADIVVRGTGPLEAIDVAPEDVPAMVDEVPALAMLAACARGTSRLHGLAELRVKESDRLAAVARGLAACGARVEVEGDTLTIHGTGAPPAGGAEIATDLDHRIAMAFLTLGCATAAPISVDDGGPIGTSFPHFAEVMAAAGADIRRLL